MVRRRGVRALLGPVVLPLVLLTAACDGQDEDTRPSTPSTTESPTSTENPTNTTRKASTMDIRLRVGGTEVEGSLDDTPTAREFAALLPLDLTLADFHGTERIADLPRRLTTTEAPAGTEAHAGDITYYAPWGNLALFYRDFPHSERLIRLGTLDPAAVDLLADLPPDAPATIESISPSTDGSPSGR
ncbi:cyclophilin-like fold protein [Saccharopolyspora pogona]|uniref:cyclophilin-like fold protein n=1 Tax=Saccharopolyspora pogona TaxID=333966 RepID=UPI001CC26EAF|nr:cyclophilin-like fold protein [Saccharopolyspora pogona]